MINLGGDFLKNWIHKLKQTPSLLTLLPRPRPAPTPLNNVLLLENWQILVIKDAKNFAWTTFSGFWGVF